MRTTITQTQQDIVSVCTELLKEPGSKTMELRAQKAGRLYAKSGKRHADGKSRSRLTYQDRGAAYLRESVCIALRTRKVARVDDVCVDIMLAARPAHTVRKEEPNRYLGAHAHAMAEIVTLADSLTRLGLEITSATLWAARAWKDSKNGLSLNQQSKLLDEARQMIATGPKEAGRSSIAQPMFHLGEPPASIRPGEFKSRPTASTPANGKVFAREATGPVEWHGSSPFDKQRGIHEAASVDRKHTQPVNGDEPLSPTVIHLNPLSSSATRSSSQDPVSMAPAPVIDPIILKQVARHRDSIVAGMDPNAILGLVTHEQKPHLIRMLVEFGQKLTRQTDQDKDMASQDETWRIWRNLGRFCGQACLDTSAGAQAFGAADVLKFPLEHRVKMLVALSARRAVLTHKPETGSPVADSLSHAILEQHHGLMTAFRREELLPPSDVRRAERLSRRVNEILERQPGQALSPGMVIDIVKAHHEAYGLATPIPTISINASLATPFEMSQDRKTLHIAKSLASAGSPAAQVARDLLVELSRSYQRDLTSQLDKAALAADDDRLTVALILAACDAPAVPVERLPDLPIALPKGALTLHAQAHAAGVLD